MRDFPHLGGSEVRRILHRTIETVAPQGLAANQTFVEGLTKRQIRVEVIPPDDPAALSYGAIATAVAFFGLLCFTVYRTTAGRIPSMSGRARVAERGENVVTFQDVAGVDEAKDEVKEIVDFLREPGRFSAIGGRIPVNPSGGLACFGEAVPAQALAQVCELTWQLRGRAGERQVEGAKVGLTINQGLFGHGSSVLLTT